MFEMLGMEQNWPKREAAWTTGDRIREVRLHMPAGTQMMTLHPPDAPDTKSCRVGWFPTAVLVLLWYDLSLPCLHPSHLEWVNIPLYTESMSFVYCFTAAKLGKCLGSQKKLWAF